MITLTKYKCEYCGEESLSKPYLQAHEKHCKTMYQADLGMYQEGMEDMEDAEDSLNNLPFSERDNPTTNGGIPLGPIFRLPEKGSYEDIKRTNDLRRLLGESEDGE